MKPANFLGAEPLIIDRLKAVLPDDVHVLAAAELADVAADEQPTPAVHVVYGGYSAQDSKTGASTVVVQRWITVVVTRNVADIQEGFHARQAAGPLAGQVIDALYRHRLMTADNKTFGASPLRLAEAPAPGFDDGHFYLPLGWECTINLLTNACPP